MEDRITDAARAEAARARLERDAAMDVAANADFGRVLANDQAAEEARRRLEVERENAALRDDANAARNWGAQNAAARAATERIAEANAGEARTATTGLFTVLAVLVVAGIIWAVWYFNQPPQTASVPTPVVNHTTIVNPPATSATTTYAPAPNPVIVNTAPASTPPTIVNNIPGQPGPSPSGQPAPLNAGSSSSANAGAANTTAPAGNADTTGTGNDNDRGSGTQNGSSGAGSDSSQ